jgi:hypothetical protein
MEPLVRAALAWAQLGESDCEEIGSGLLGQPLNAGTSTAYTVAGLWLVARALRNRGDEMPMEIVYGIALASVGLGSLAFHGPVPPGARLLHDLTIAFTLIVIAVRGGGSLLGWPQRRVLQVIGLVVLATAVVMAAAPDAGNLLSGVYGVSAVTTEVLVYRAGRRRLPVQAARILGTAAGLLVVASVINLLGRTDGPLCDPDGVFQGHAVWHVLTASVFMLYGYVAFPRSMKAVS